jgi:hypothetical protein
MARGFIGNGKSGGAEAYFHRALEGDCPGNSLKTPPDIVLGYGDDPVFCGSEAGNAEKSHCPPATSPDRLFGLTPVLVFRT